MVSTSYHFLPESAENVISSESSMIWDVTYSWTNITSLPCWTTLIHSTWNSFYLLMLSIVLTFVILSFNKCCATEWIVSLRNCVCICKVLNSCTSYIDWICEVIVLGLDAWSSVSSRNTLQALENHCVYYPCSTQSLKS